MFFIVPLLSAFAALTVSIGEAIGIGAGLMGIGAGIKGSTDYHQAKTLQEDAYNRYQTMIRRIHRETKIVQDRLDGFSILRLETYTGIIREAAEVLSQFKNIDLSSFKDIQVEHISFLTHELDTLNASFITASDVLSCLSIGVNAAVYDRFPYKDTPSLVAATGDLDFTKVPVSGLPRIPYAALAMAGLSWGISGNTAKTQARAEAAKLSCETERLESVIAGYKALLERVDEGEHLIASLTEKLRAVLGSLQSVPLPVTDNTSSATAIYLETTISLTRALKQVIEADVCTGNGFLTRESGIVFNKIRKEYAHV
jgi:hypothetical protein